MQDWIWGFSGNFLFFKFENQESFSLILQTKNSLEILKTFFKLENFFDSYIKQEVQFLY